jgi:large subunit ribosomal protein L24
MMRIRRNDIVEVISGEEQGKRGRVLKVLLRKSRVIVEGVNYIIRHVKQSQSNVEGGRVQKEAPIFISKVLPVCDKCGKGVRVGYRLDENKKKVRYCRNKGCNAVISPEK